MQVSNDELCHWGIKGMKWDVRRYQNPDGALTGERKRRYTEAGKNHMQTNGADR